MSIGPLFVFLGCAHVHSLYVGGPNHPHTAATAGATVTPATAWDGTLGAADDPRLPMRESMVGGHGQTRVSLNHHNHGREQMSADGVVVNSAGHSSVHNFAKKFNVDAPASTQHVHSHASDKTQTDVHNAFGSGAGNGRSEGNGDFNNVLETQNDAVLTIKPGKMDERSQAMYSDKASNLAHGINFAKARYSHGKLKYWSEGSDYQHAKVQGNKALSEADSHHAQSNEGVDHYDTAVHCICDGGVAEHADCVKGWPSWCLSCDVGVMMKKKDGTMVQAEPKKHIHESKVGGIVQSCCGECPDDH